MAKQEVTNAVEPTRRSFLNVLQDNLQAANRVTFVHRLIYIGEHTFPENSDFTIADYLATTLDAVNNNYTDEELTGFLVYYPKYFCHIIEGSEESINKHLKLLFDEDNQYKDNIKRTKLLVCYHHINQRFLQTWIAITGKPPSLLERIDVNCDLIRTSRYIYNCVSKLYSLADHQRPKPSIQMSESTSLLSTVKSTLDNENESTIIMSESKPERTSKLQVSVSIQKFPEFLPEYGLLEFLLITNYTQDLRDYYKTYGELPELEAYRDKTWPVICDFIPLNIFDAPYDPCTDLPTVAQAVQVQEDIMSELIE